MAKRITEKQKKEAVEKLKAETSKKETEAKKKIGDVESVKAEIVARPYLSATFAQAEIDSQIATAKRFPRNISEFKDKCRTLVTEDREIAASCFYAVPRAGKSIEGPSVRLAEIALSCFRNCVAQADVSHEDKNFVYAIGMCRDLENNTAVRVTVRRRITDKNGHRFKDDMIAVTANAAASIALRNAIFKIVPSAYIKPIFEAVRQISIGDKQTIANARAGILDLIHKMGVDDKRVLHVLKRKSIEDVTRNDLITLQGYVNAVKDGDAEIETVFPDIEAEEEAMRAAAGEKLEATPTEPDKKKDSKKKEKKAAAKKKTNLF